MQAQSARKCHCYIDSQTVLYNYCPVGTNDAINDRRFTKEWDREKQGAFAESRKVTVSLSRLSVRPNGATRPPPDGFS